ncbi:MAG: hypothetical protein QM490_03165 [Candidatus Gracilibacteria bacterium]
MVEYLDKNTLESPQKQTNLDVVGNLCCEKINNVLNLDIELDGDLIDVVLKTRILDFLLSGEKDERIQKQIVFFSNICSNIIRNSTEEWKENVSCKYVINKYKPGKYDSLMHLFKSNKPIGEENLSFFIDDFVKNIDLIDGNMVDLNKNNISQKEIVESQILGLSGDKQRKILEKIYSNYKKNNKTKKTLMAVIVGLVGGWEKQDRRIKKRGYEKYLLYKTQGKEPTIKLYTQTVQKLSTILLEKPEIGEGIVDKETGRLIFDNEKSVSNNCFDIDRHTKLSLKKYNFKKSLLIGTRDEKIKNQRTFFDKIVSNIEKQEKNNFTTLYKFLWKKENKGSFALRRLMKGTHPIGEKNLNLIFEILFSKKKLLEKVVNIDDIKITNNDLLFFRISKLTIGEQKLFLEVLHENISKSDKYKNIVNRGGGKIAATLKNFINPLKTNFKEKYIRQKIKDVLYSTQKRIPTHILNLLVEKLLEDTDLFTSILDMKTGKLVLLECEQDELQEEVQEIKKINYLKDLYKKYSQKK